MPSTLETILRKIPNAVIAVSGGVDSMTLAAVAATVLRDVTMMHAVSPAVPGEATERVRMMAVQRAWRLTIVDAREFADPRYRANPVNRCFYCKTNLYGTIRARTTGQILSGANLDDLGEYRPGLDAARDHDVRHPYIEAGIGKRQVRDIARSLGLMEVSELPSSPCLASRVETGIPIDPQMLGFIHRVERLVAAELMPGTIRCRVRAAAVVIELDAAALHALQSAGEAALAERIADQLNYPGALPVRFERYRTGSAFLGKPA